MFGARKEAALGDGSTEKPGQEPSGKTAAYALQSVAQQNPTVNKWGEVTSRFFLRFRGVPHAPSLRIDLDGPVSHKVSISSLGRWTDEFAAVPHYTPLLRSL